MIRRYKKILALLLVGVMGSFSSISVMASNEQTTSIAGIVDETDTVEMDLTDARTNDKIDDETLDILAWIESVTYEDLSGYCTVKEADSVDGVWYGEYNFESELVSFLCNAKAVNNVSFAGDNIYVNYITGNSNEVTFGIDQSGESDVTVYFPESDIAENVCGNQFVEYINFRQGIYYEMPEEQSELIEQYLEEDNIEAIEAIPGIIVEEFDGSVIVDIETQELALDFAGSNEDVSVFSVATPTTNSELLANLKQSFPMYSKSLKLSKTITCDELNKGLTVKVYEGRDNYKKVNANWLSFMTGTTISVIATALGGPVTGVLAKVLTTAGLVASGADFINQSIQLSKSAVYSFSGSRVGYVYDPTNYNDYVKAITYKNTGKFTGGFDSNGNYAWVMSTTPAAYTKSYTTVATKAMAVYNTEVAMNGKNISLYPD